MTQPPMYGTLLPLLPISLLSDLSPLQRLKSALWLHVGRLVDEESLALNANATPQFIGALTEMVWSQIGRRATDEPCG